MEPRPVKPAHECIFLVDDEPEFTSLMSTLLEHGLSVTVLAFNDPVVALEALAQSAPSFLVSDLIMPRMNGLEFLGEVARRRPDLPCLLVTGNALDPLRVERSHIPSLLQVLYKPVSWRDIAAVYHQRPGCA